MRVGFSQRRQVVVLSCLIFTTAVYSQEQQESNCTGQYQGRRLGPKVLSAIFVDRHSWVTERQRRKAKPNDERQANLCGADLTNANRQKADLSRANLQWTIFEYANL